MALASNALIDISYVSRMLHSVDVGDDDFAEELINQASSIAEGLARRQLIAREVTEVLDGSGRTRLLLREYPVQAVASVHIDADRGFGSDTEVSDYYVESGPGILHRDAGFGRVAQSVRVVYTGGPFASLDDVDSDLQEAVVELVSWLWTRQRSNNIAIRATEGLDGVRTEHELTIPLQARRTIESYGRLR
ncbi:MAG: hypothetical protein ACOCZB_08910 [Spirochaetota bacterium]